MSCDHRGKIDDDVLSRSVCSLCGEVLIQIEEPVLGSSPGGDYAQISPTARTLIDSICLQFQQSSGVLLPPELRDRVNQLVAMYRSACGTSPVFSFENLVRASLLVILRGARIAVPPSKIIPRFDGKNSSIFRLLSRMHSSLGVKMEPLDAKMLINHCVEVVLSRLGQSDIYPDKIVSGAGDRDLLCDVVSLSSRVLEIMVSHGPFATTARLSQAVACTYYVIRNGCVHSPRMRKRDLTLLSCIRMLNLEGSEQSVYKNFEEINSFFKQCLIDIGVRDGEGQGITYLRDIERKLSSKMHLSKKIRLISGR
jgi:hypothetical protein